MEAPVLHELIANRYKDRGGWRVACEIFRADLPYEVKLENIRTTFRVSRITAMRWYSHFRSLEGLK